MRHTSVRLYIDHIKFFSVMNQRPTVKPNLVFVEYLFFFVLESTRSNNGTNKFLFERY